MTPPAPPDAPDLREKMNIVIVGHVDHGKSTVVGRLLADTGSLPQGKLEAVKEQCRRNAKPFEYAFLLDALKDEQTQGITIDSARCFFKSARRDYIIIDAPGHLEFLKNMVSGAARAEGALLVIDAKEGVRENSRRHGYLLGLLGIRQIAVCINKMDLVDYRQDVYDAIVAEYSEFLRQVDIKPMAFIPISARDGVNIVRRGDRMPWYDGPAALEMVDRFVKEPHPIDKPLRMPVQDIYKFTEAGDDRRIVTGRIETGQVAVGDEVVFLPSGKRSTVASIEEFNAPRRDSAEPGRSTGVTLTTQVYIKPGELMVKADQVPPRVTTQIRSTLFWLGKAPMVKGRRYKLKLAGARTQVWLTDIAHVLDASTLELDAHKDQVERHDVAQVVLETLKPIACDLAADIPSMGRFVIIDNYEIAGGGIVLDATGAQNTLSRKHVAERERAWDRSRLTPDARRSRTNQRATLLLLTGREGTGKAELAKRLEERLFQDGRMVYYLGLSNSLLGDSEVKDQRDEYLRRLGEIAHLFTDAGLILIATVTDLDDGEMDVIRTLNQPGDLLVVNIGDSALQRHKADLTLPVGGDPGEAASQIERLLQSKHYLPEYYL